MHIRADIEHVPFSNLKIIPFNIKLLRLTVMARKLIIYYMKTLIGGVMKLSKQIFIVLIIAAFTITGCGKRQDFPTIPLDQDNDYIPDDYEVQDNEEKKTIPCVIDEETTVYLDCVTEEDCNCNKIPDGEELEIIEEECHSWKCVMNAGARPYLMIGGVLISGYILGQLVSNHWPFGGDDDKPDKDLAGNDIDYITLDGPPDWDKSFFKIFKDGGKNYMYIKVVGKCKKDSLKEPIDCWAEVKNEINDYPKTITPNVPNYGDIVKGPLTYRFNLNESIINSRDKQYIKVYIEKDGEKVIKDPEWIGLKKYNGLGETGVNTSYMLLKDKQPGASGHSIFERMGFATSEDEANRFLSGDKTAEEVFVTFAYDGNINNFREDDEYLFYQWYRINSAEW